MVEAHYDEATRPAGRYLITQHSLGVRHATGQGVPQDAAGEGIWVTI